MPIMNTVIQGGGSTPTGTKQITTNGTHDVAAYEYADVQVPTTAPEIYRVFRNNNGKLENSQSTPFIPLPSTITDIGEYCMYNAYRATPSSVLSGAIDLSNLTQLSGNNACYQMFQGCTGITSVDLSSLTTISGSVSSMFYGCTPLTSLNLSSLTTISGSYACSSMFKDCTALASVDLSGLTTISGSSGCNGMFEHCTSITSVAFNSLSTLSGSTACKDMFKNCTSLTSLSFPALTSTSFGTQVNQLNNLLSSNITGCTIHFPSNLDPSGGSTVISSLTGYPNFGGTNTVLAFDLPATE